MNFRVAKYEDLEFVRQHSLFPDDVKEQVAQADYEFTLEHVDKILLIGGFRLITNSTCWGWFQMTEFVGNHIQVVYRVIKEYTEIWCKNHNIKRLQIYVESDFEKGLRVAKHLGFKKECDMKHFMGKDRDAVLFVRYFGGD
jgi:RimJ/RimL family protein N-acetyltransferase